MLRADEQTDSPVGKISDDLPDHRNRWVCVVVHRKQNLVVPVILPAKTCEILVGAEVHTPHRFEYADGRAVIRDGSRSLALEETESRQRRERVVNQRSRRQHQHRIPPHFEVWRDAVLGLAAAPLVYYALATLAAFRFFKRERARAIPNYRPAVSVLKPVRGVDFGSYENFASFCRQDYRDYEILFAVNDDADPAVPVIRQIIADFPDRRIRLLIGAEHLGTNRKVNKLARLVDPEIGAVTCFYRGIAEKNLDAEIEAIGASSDFFAGVLMADWTEGITFALGASIAITREWLNKMGGFPAMADALADDYELGNRIAKAGGEVVLSPEAVWTMYPAQTFRGFWDHQVRWARTVRLCRPWSYVGLLFTQGLPWALLAV